MNSILTSLPHASVGRQGSLAGGLRQGLAHAGAAIWRALEAVGRVRAQPHLLAFADRCEAQQPELARELRAACRRGPLS